MSFNKKAFTNLAWRSWQKVFRNRSRLIIIKELTFLKHWFLSRRLQTYFKALIFLNCILLIRLQQKLVRFELVLGPETWIDSTRIRRQLQLHHSGNRGVRRKHVARVQRVRREARCSISPQLTSDRNSPESKPT